MRTVRSGAGAGPINLFVIPAAFNSRMAGQAGTYFAFSPPPCAKSKMGSSLRWNDEQKTKLQRPMSIAR
jgi:hypothetical protein